MFGQETRVVESVSQNFVLLKRFAGMYGLHLHANKLLSLTPKSMEGYVGSTCFLEEALGNVLHMDQDNTKPGDKIRETHLR